MTKEMKKLKAKAGEHQPPRPLVLGSEFTDLVQPGRPVCTSRASALNYTADRETK